MIVLYNMQPEGSLVLILFLFIEFVSIFACVFVFVSVCIYVCVFVFVNCIAVFAGVVAAAGLFGLEHVYPRLGEDHERCNFYHEESINTYVDNTNTSTHTNYIFMP